LCPAWAGLTSMSHDGPPADVRHWMENQKLAGRARSAHSGPRARVRTAQPVDRALGTCRRGDSGGVSHRRSRGVVAEVGCCLDGARARHEVQAAASYSKALKHEKAKSRRAQRGDRSDATAGNGRAPQQVRCSLALSDALASTRTLAAIGVYRSRIGESEEKSPHPTENAEAPEVSDFSPRLWATMSGRTGRRGAGVASSASPWSLIASPSVAFCGLAAWRCAAILFIPLSRSLRGSGRLDPCEVQTARS
jgi:hypothetical protein